MTTLWKYLGSTMMLAVLVGVFLLDFNACRRSRTESEPNMRQGKFHVDTTIKAKPQPIRWIREDHTPKPLKIYVTEKCCKKHGINDALFVDSNTVMVYDTSFTFSDTVKAREYYVIINDSLGGRIYKRSVGVKLFIPDTVFMTRVDTLISEKPKSKAKLNVGVQVGLYLTPAGIQPGIGIGIDLPLWTPELLLKNKVSVAK